MANATRLLLQLPLSLRQQILQEPSRSMLRLNATAIRTYAQKGKPLPPPPKAFVNQQTPAEAPLPKTKLARPPPTLSEKSLPATIPGDAILGEKQKRDAMKNVVLLYTAPRHGIFYAASYLAGGFFILGAYTYSELVLKDPADGSKQPWWKKSIGAISALAAASFGTVFILGPMGMIKSISVVTSEAGFTNATAKFTRAPRLLRIEIKRKLPFLKPDVLETDVSNVALDRRVPAALHDLNFHSIPRAYSESWTADYLAGAAEPARSGSITAAVKGLWPATRREVRRMFLRDQIAYVQVKGPRGDSSFKLDLQGCRMLEGGQAMDRVLVEDLAMNRGVYKWLHNLIGG